MKTNFLCLALVLSGGLFQSQALGAVGRSFLDGKVFIATEMGEVRTHSNSGQVANPALDSAKTNDQRMETIILPSGEVLENHTYYSSDGRTGERINELFLKNPTTGASERIGAQNNLSYEANSSQPALLERFPHPQEMVRVDEKVLIIGPYVCERLQVPEHGPYWYIAAFDLAAGEAAEYLQSFYKPANPALATRPGEGPAGHMRYAIEKLDLENNVLIVQRVPWNAQVDFSEYRDGYPDYLVYSANGFIDQSGYGYPWKFDVARTRAKNGPRWERPMPFKMVLEYSVITFPIKNGIMANRESRQSALAHAGAKEANATLELSDQRPRNAECRYTLAGTNQIEEKIEAMYGFACGQTNRFHIVWQPHNPAAWPVSCLNLNEWVPVGVSAFGSDLSRNEFIRLRRIEP